MASDVVKDVLELAERHKYTWRDKPEWYWYVGLLEEVCELGLALMGLHRHVPDWELTK